MTKPALEIRPDVFGSGRYAILCKSRPKTNTSKTAMLKLMYLRTLPWGTGKVLTYHHWATRRPPLDHVPLRFYRYPNVVVLLLNGFFAAAEVALVSVRKSRLRALAAEGQEWRAQAALNLLANPARLLSVTQVGVTLASLGLGWAGENSVYSLFLSIFQPGMPPKLNPVLHAVSFGLAFLLISFAHVVLGEVVPKNLAIEKADRLAILVAPALLAFDRISAPGSSTSRHARLRRFPAGSGLRGAAYRRRPLSAEELKFIVELQPSGRPSSSASREDAIQSSPRTSQLLRPCEIMVPRNAIVSVLGGRRSGPGDAADARKPVFPIARL